LRDPPPGKHPHPSPNITTTNPKKAPPPQTPLPLTPQNNPPPHTITQPTSGRPLPPLPPKFFHLFPLPLQLVTPKPPPPQQNPQKTTPPQPTPSPSKPPPPPPPPPKSRKILDGSPAKRSLTRFVLKTAVWSHKLFSRCDGFQRFLFSFLQECGEDIRCLGDPVPFILNFLFSAALPPNTFPTRPFFPRPYPFLRFFR